MVKKMVAALCLLAGQQLSAQVKWVNMDTAFADLPASVHVYRTQDMLDGKPNIAWYVEADLKDRSLIFSADTTLNRRQTPSQFYERNHQPLLVVNCTFFSFATNRNLNTVIRNGELVGYNIHSLPGKGKDTLTYRHPLGSAIGISKKRKADVAWLYTDSSKRFAYARQESLAAWRDSVETPDFKTFTAKSKNGGGFRKWKMQTAIGGGPVLLQNGEIKVTNEEEVKFTGKGLTDKHPRTAMGYTASGKLIVMVIEGRNPGIAEGASLEQEARLFKELGCAEALNLDGGGSSCMLVNGKETIKPSDKQQRPVPAVFIISRK